MNAVQNKVLVLGAGKIGALIACFLADQDDYLVTLADMNDQSLKGWDKLLNNLHTISLDVHDGDKLYHYLSSYRYDAVISALPFFCNSTVAKLADQFQIAYFDLSEDIAVAQFIQSISREHKTAFVPQCGLAPGFISIVANDLMQHFDKLETVKLRVGALPVNPSNVLKYSLTWSTEGLINEYSNLCHGIEEGHSMTLLPLEGYETIELDGLLYEAFNTSGGLGTLADTYKGQVKSMNYKTLRYPGHCQMIRFMMKDLKLKDDRQMLKTILENAIPKTLTDVVLIYVSVTGRQQGELVEENYVNKIYPQTFLDKHWSAIQVTTAASICALTDLVLQQPGKYKGFIKQESFSLDQFLSNRFGRYYTA